MISLYTIADQSVQSLFHPEVICCSNLIAHYKFEIFHSETQHPRFLL